MLKFTQPFRIAQSQLSREALRQVQLDKFNRQMEAILPLNQFYQNKYASCQFPLAALDDLADLSYTFKDVLVIAPFEGQFAANLTYPLSHYVRFHRTSGTRGRPLPVLDTPQDWQWWIETWQYVLDAAELTPEDRVVMAFSFGPFIGFWSAHDAVIARGLMVIPTGGLNTLARLDLIRSTRATVIFCTPSYALHMAEVALENQIDPASLSVRKIIVSGEPGGSLPDTRQRIEAAWNARLVDHAGASEVGPWGLADAQGRGLRVIETEFIAEFRSLTHDGPAAEGEEAELVLTSLGRYGSPVIRYRTGDVVRPRWTWDEENHFVLLEGGVLGRCDDMFIVRGVNVFPSSLEQILRSFPEVVEYQTTIRRQGEMDFLSIDVEDRLQQPDRIARELQLRLGLKVNVQLVPAGSLPRYEGKGRRFIDRRSE